MGFMTNSGNMPGGGSKLPEIKSLVRSARMGKAAGAKDVEHMDGAAAAFTYICVANLVASRWHAGEITAPVLDWGCGYGQVSWLLRERGVEVLSYDVQERPARVHMPPINSVDIKYGNDPVHLPYPSASIGAVLSVGVLEHVPDITGSLWEINRVLRLGGTFFVLMLPNRYSWAEWIADVRDVSAHPVKFTFRTAESLLTSHGFEVERRWKRNFLPKNLTGLPQWFKCAYGSLFRQIEALDKLLANVPPASLFSGVLEFIARKRLSLEPNGGVAQPGK
jgi:SAM-dependent methyltransferase